MAQLKDLIVNGASRFIGDIFGNKAQLTTLEAPTSAGGTTYGPGSNGNVLRSNGSSVYWGSVGNAVGYNVTDRTSATAIGTGTGLMTERAVYYGLPTINNAHNYTSSTTIYAPTAGGTANTQALVGNGATTAPKWVNISPSISITAGTSSATPKVNVTVLGQSGTAQAITTATTGVYGATKLTDAYTSTDATLAATGKSILAAIQTLDVSSVGGGTGEYISTISETDGKISATKATTTVSNTWTAGTTAGPTIKTTVNGVAGTAVAIPSAAAGASGVVTTAAQQFDGNKTFKGHIYPQATSTYDLGSNALRWRTIYLKGDPGINYIMNADTSNAKVPLGIYNTSNTLIGEIGYHNTGDTGGAFVITPYAHSGTNFWGGSIGLYIGKNSLKWENKYILRYSAAATSGNVVIADGTAGNVKTSAYSLSATVNAGTAGRMTRYSGANAISDSPNIQYRSYNTTVTGNRTTAGAVCGLLITGTCYGNDAAYLASTDKGVFAIGDPGPQLQFGNAEGTAKAAIIYTNQNGIKTTTTETLEGSSFHFVSDEDPVHVVAGGFVAKNRISVGTNHSNASYALYVNGTGYFANNVTLANANIALQRVGRSVYWHKGRDSAVVKTTSIDGYGALASVKTTNGSWEIGAYNQADYTDDLLFSYITDTLYNGSSATTTAQIKFLENSHIATRGYDLINSGGDNQTYGSLNIDIAGTTSTGGLSMLNLGNNIATGTAKNARGMIRMYSASTYKVDISSVSLTANRTATLPNATGWVAVGGNGSSTGVAGANQIMYLSTSGVLTAGTSATNANTANTIVKRDGSGNFSAGTITANLTGTASKATAANLTTTANAVAYYTNTTGTFGSKASANGALYATSANGALTFGTLPTGQGGTGNTSYTANMLIYGESATKLASATKLYATTNKIGINVTSEPTYQFKVKGISEIGGIVLNKATISHTPEQIVSMREAGYHPNWLPADSLNPPTGLLFFTSGGSGAGIGSVSATNDKFYLTGIKAEGDPNLYYNSHVYVEDNVMYGAAWNDYAEYRESFEIEPGRVVIELGNGRLIKSTDRLQPGAEVISDTYGFVVGEGNQFAHTPIAVAGRVLVYPYENKTDYGAGDAVCSGPNGTISKMTREEIREYPERIIGTVSEIPDYEYWGENHVKVNGRIWIRLR